MPYIENGVIRSRRSKLRWKTITDFFWAVVYYVEIFFLTMFSMEKSDDYKKGSGAKKKWDGGGSPGPRGPPRRLNDFRGVDHSPPVHGCGCG